MDSDSEGEEVCPLCCNELDATDERMLMSTVLNAHADETKTAIHEVDDHVHTALGQQYGNTHFGGTIPEAETSVELELCGTGEKQGNPELTSIEI